MDEKLQKDVEEAKRQLAELPQWLRKSIVLEGPPRMQPYGARGNEERMDY